MKPVAAVASFTLALALVGCTSTDETSPTTTTTRADVITQPTTATPPPATATATATATPTVEDKSEPLEGLHSPILGIDLPPGSDGFWIVNDFNDDGKPNHLENWPVPQGYDETVAYLTEQLNPHYTRPDGMPWLEGDEPEGELGDRYVDWWWGVSEPELLVRMQEYGEPDETTVHVESRPL